MVLLEFPEVSPVTLSGFVVISLMKTPPKAELLFVLALRILASVWIGSNAVPIVPVPAVSWRLVVDIVGAPWKVSLIVPLPCTLMTTVLELPPLNPPICEARTKLPLLVG